MYTTLSPCDMCTGACLLYKVKRVVIGLVDDPEAKNHANLPSENKTFVGGEKLLKERGVQVVVLQNAECESLMQKFIANKPEEWFVNPCRQGLYSHLTLQRNEDIGEKS